ncbi:MAG: DegT/DnrJ/EryC1/StrS family aminotransferase [Casimicrobiaceae bacterium]
MTSDSNGVRAALPLFRTRVSPAARARLLATLDSGWLGYGPQCRQLEERFTAGRGGWALATSSCTSALYLAGRLVRALAGGEQPEIIVPSVSFVASGMAFLQAGVRPVVAEVGAEGLLLTAQGARHALSANTRAVLAVHLYGQRCPALAALRAFADEHHLLLIEDCAHRVDLLDQVAPSGDLLCYSFNAVKELPGGEGGLLWGRDRRHEAWVRPVSNLGLAVDTVQRTAALRHADYAFAADTGLKLRGNDVAASLVNAAIESLAASRAQRREQFRRYDRLLAGLAADVRPLQRRDNDSCLMYVIRVAAQRRDALRTSMANAGVATSVHYPSLARHPLFGSDRPRACCGDQDETVVTLPTFAELTADDQQHIVATLAAALAGARSSPTPPASAAGAQPRSMRVR